MKSPVKPLRILCVDDHAPMLTVLALRLREKGHVVETAPDGLQALDRFKKAPDFDVVTTDFAMPGLDGAGLARQLRALGFAGKLVIASGSYPPDIQETLKDCSVNEFLCKPIDYPKLFEAIQA